MITHSIFPTKKGHYRAEVVFLFGSRKHRLPRFCTDISRVSREIEVLKKRILIDELQKFINHRREIINHHGGMMTTERLKAIERMQILVEISKGAKCSLMLFARRIQEHRRYLLLLIPGISSRYYQNQECFVIELLTDCNAIVAAEPLGDTKSKQR